MKHLLILFAILMGGCIKPPEGPVEPDPKPIIDACNPYEGINILSPWVFKIGDALILRHTPGLEQMAITGSHSLLNFELCGEGRPATIPSGLEDDPEGDGYAGQLQYGDYILAMYHPITYPDHFITYNTKDGSWIRWDLSDGPGIFRQSN